MHLFYKKSGNIPTRIDFRLLSTFDFISMYFVIHLGLVHFFRVFEGKIFSARIAQITSIFGCLIQWLGLLRKPKNLTLKNQKQRTINPKIYLLPAY